MAEIDLLTKYPKTKRDLATRKKQKSARAKKIARKFDKDYYDGDRIYGYGGYFYHPRFWTDVVKKFRDYYRLTAKSRILDVGCAKGFMLFDFKQLIPDITLSGIDISSYAIQHAIPEIRPCIQKANAKALPFPDKSFDLVISINTIHNLPLADCRKAITEIMRVSKQYAYITVDAYRSETEKERMNAWNLTALTYMHVDSWKQLFAEIGYTGDYYWFIP